MDDASEIGARTWAEIAGDGNVVERRIVDDDVTKAVDAMSVAGMTLGSQQDAADEVADGTQVSTGILYKGISGTVFCNGDNCKVEAVQDADGDDIEGMRKLVGSWYFTPASTTELYVSDSAGSNTVATMYARYGYWLTYAQDGAATVNTYAASGSVRHRR